MKKHLKKIGVAMVIAAALITWTTAYPSCGTPVNGCRYTGNIGDYCVKTGMTVYNCCNSTTTSCGI